MTLATCRNLRAKSRSRPPPPKSPHNTQKASWFMRNPRTKHDILSLPNCDNSRHFMPKTMSFRAPLCHFFALNGQNGTECHHLAPGVTRTNHDIPRINHILPRIKGDIAHINNHTPRIFPDAPRKTCTLPRLKTASPRIKLDGQVRQDAQILYKKPSNKNRFSLDL